MFAWFDATEAKKFGEKLAHFMIDRLPKVYGGKEKTFTQKMERVLSQAASQVMTFKQEQRLNAYKKAQLGNAFKWALRDAGFTNEYSDELTKWLIVKLG